MPKNLLFEWSTKREYVDKDGVKHMKVIVEIWDPEVFMGWIRDVDLDFIDGEPISYHDVVKKISEELDDFDLS
jgi:hypothetical protein